MKRLKPNSRKITFSNGSVGAVDLRTMHVRARWWTKARIPGEMRPSRIKNYVRYGRRMRGFLRLDVYV